MLQSTLYSKAKSSFYKKMNNSSCVTIVSSHNSSDAALKESARIVERMLEKNEDLKKALCAAKVRVAVIASTESTTDIPEHSKLEPKDYWNERTRGLASIEDALSSVGEENVLNAEKDRYVDESILIHEFAHIIHEVGFAKIDSKFESRLKKIYEQAHEKKLWANTYADENYLEYWAEGVQSYFNANLESLPSNGIHNHVNTRAELEQFDPDLFKLIDQSFGKNPWLFRAK